MIPHSIHLFFFFLKNFLLLVETKKNLVSYFHQLLMYTNASRETTELPQSIKVVLHISATYTSFNWQEHNATGRALPRNADQFEIRPYACQGHGWTVSLILTC
jgi:hypothetical protein